MLALQVILCLILSPVMIVFSIVYMALGLPIRQYQEWGNGLIEKIKELK